MGSIVSNLIFGRGQSDANDDLVDSKTGFTRKEKKLMDKTWNGNIRGALIEVGVNAMLKLLEQHREIHDLFPDFKDKSLVELESSKKFHVHCQMIMNTVNSAVEAFLADDVELFTAILKLTAERHGKRGILPQHMKCVTDPLLYSMKLKMKSQWTKEVEELWSRAACNIMESIANEIDVYNKT